MDRDTTLTNANIPQEKWSECYVSTDGRVFTPTKDENENIIKTAEERYNEVTNPPEPTPEPTQEDYLLDLDYRLSLIELGV